MKAMRMGLLLLLVLPIAWILWYRWDSSRNRGYTFGYWGEFNAVANALARIPGVVIIESGANQDISLEEFWFELRNSQGERFRLGFGEKDPIRKMSGPRLARSLAQRVKKKSSGQP